MPVPVSVSVFTLMHACVSVYVPLYMHGCVCVWIHVCLSLSLATFPYTFTLTSTSDRVHLYARASTCVAPSQSQYVSNTHSPCPTSSPINQKTIPASSPSKKGPPLAKNMFKFSQVRSLVMPCVQKKICSINIHILQIKKTC